jgi:hypothetical protein
MNDTPPEEIIRVTVGWASIVRSYAAEANVGVHQPKRRADEAGWTVLRDHLMEVAALLEWFAEERAAVHGLPRPSEAPLDLEKTG